MVPNTSAFVFADLTWNRSESVYPVDYLRVILKRKERT